MEGHLEALFAWELRPANDWEEKGGRKLRRKHMEILHTRFKLCPAAPLKVEPCPRTTAVTFEVLDAMTFLELTTTR